MAKYIFLAIFVLNGCALMRQNKGDRLECRGGACVDEALSDQARADYLFTRSEALSQKGEVKKALEGFREALRLQPNSLSLRLRLAKELVRDGQMAEALDHLQKIENTQDGGPLLSEALILKAQIFSQGENFEAAIEVVQKAIRLFPDDSYLWLFLGGLYGEQKKWGQAIEAFEKALQLPNTQKEQVYYLLGRCYLEIPQGGKAKARDYFEKSLELKPSFVEPLMALVSLDLERGESSAAIKRLESWQEREGPQWKVAETLLTLYIFNNHLDKAFEQARLLMTVSEDSKDVQLKVAFLLIQNRKYSEAAILLESLLEQQPSWDRVKFALGTLYWEMKNPGQALKNFTAIAPSSEFFMDSVMAVIQIYFDQKDWVAAKDFILQKIQQLPHDEEILYVSLVSVLDELKDYKECSRWIRQGQDKFPDSEMLMFLEALNLERQGDTERAIKKGLALIERNPNHAMALNFVAYLWAERNENLDQALTYALKAVELDSQNGHYLDSLGYLYYKLDDLEKSIFYLEQAYQKLPQESIIQEHLADAYFRSGLLEKARLFYSMAYDFCEEKERRSLIQKKLHDLSVAVKERDARGRSPASTKGPLKNR